MMALLETPGLGPRSVPRAPQSAVSAEPRKAPERPARFDHADRDDRRELPSFELRSNPLTRLLRGSIIADAAIFVAGFGQSLLYFFATANEGPEKPLSPSEVIACVGFVFYGPALIAAWIGLWLMRNWSRWLYLVLVVIGHVMGLGSSLVDFSATWQFPGAVMSFGNSVGGILIGLAFFSPLALEFRKSSDPQRVSPTLR